MIDVILAWLVAEDDGAKKKIEALLADRDEDLSLVRGTLEGERNHIGPYSWNSIVLTNITEQIEGLGEEDAGERDLKEMLETLLQFTQPSGK